MTPAFRIRKSMRGSRCRAAAAARTLPRSARSSCCALMRPCSTEGVRCPSARAGCRQHDRLRFAPLARLQHHCCGIAAHTLLMQGVPKY
jgi:hypothetical protein